MRHNWPDSSNKNANRPPPKPPNVSKRCNELSSNNNRNNLYKSYRLNKRHNPSEFEYTSLADSRPLLTGRFAFSAGSDE